MSTPHNEASLCGIAKTVIMPGDPKRSEFIATTFLKSPQLVNDIRGVHGYTGIWKDVPVTVMASGMGMPSIGLYSWELYDQYDVDNIIRVGSAGSLRDDINLMDIVIAQGACTTSNYIANFGLNGTFAPISSYEMISKCVQAAEENKLPIHVGNVLSSDNFYSVFNHDKKENSEWKHFNVMAIEMECAALFANAAYFGKNALGILTISDHLFKNEHLEAEKRQIGFSNMITLALDTAVKMEEARIAQLN